MPRFLSVRRYLHCVNRHRTGLTKSTLPAFRLQITARNSLYMDGLILIAVAMFINYASARNYSSPDKWSCEVCQGKVAISLAWRVSEAKVYVNLLQMSSLCLFRSNQKFNIKLGMGIKKGYLWGDLNIPGDRLWQRIIKGWSGEKNHTMLWVTIIERALK